VPDRRLPKHAPRRGSSSGAEGSRPEASQAPTDLSVILRRGELYGQGANGGGSKPAPSAARIWFGAKQPKGVMRNATAAVPFALARGIFLAAGCQQPLGYEQAGLGKHAKRLALIPRSLQKHPDPAH
jgi:hypothetical protein